MNAFDKRKNNKARICFHGIFLLLILFFSSSKLFAQQSPIVEWQKCLGGMKSEDGVGGNQNSFIQTSDGGYAVIGSTHSTDGDVFGFTSTIADNIWIVKLNSLGLIQWQKCLGGKSNNWANGIIQTNDKGYAISGYTDSDDGDVSGNHGGVDAWVVKLDSIGKIEWQKCVGGSGFDAARSILQTTGGAYLIAGYTESKDEGFFNHGSGDAFIAKLSSSGDMLWQKCFGGSQYDDAYCIIQTSDGEYIFTGATKSDDGDVAGHHGDSTKKNLDVWVVKLDSLGTIKWQRCLGGSRDDGGNSIVQSCDKGYAICGYTISTDGDVSGLHGDTSKKRTSDIWAVKIDSIGTIEWQKCLGGSSNEIGSSIIQTFDCGFAIAGWTGSNDADVSGNHGGDDAWVVKLSSSGKLAWQKCLGGTDHEEGFTIIQTADKGYAIDGRTNSPNNGDVSGIHIGGDSANRTFDIWVVKLKEASNVALNTNPYLGPTNFFMIYPNPSWDYVHLQIWGNQTIQKVTFYDIIGREFSPSYELDGNKATVNVRALSPGIYMARLTFSYNDYIGNFTLPLVVQH